MAGQHRPARSLRAIPNSQWLASLLVGVAPVHFVHALERACPPRAANRIRLTLSLHGEVAFAEFDGSCKHPALRTFQLVERELSALPSPTTCQARTLPPAGLHCLPDAKVSDFVLIRRGEEQLHALDQTLVDITCSTLRERVRSTPTN